MKNYKFILTVLVVILLLASCAHTEPSYTVCLTGHTFGFWGGLWHGLIAPFDFIGSIIWKNITIYAPNNNGAWYGLGFLIGIGGLSGGILKHV